MRPPARSAALLVALAALAAASTPASAQLPLLPPPGPAPGGGPPPPPPPPPATPPAPPGDAAVTYRGNVAGTREAGTRSVFGPLGLAWRKRFDGAVNQPLIVGGRVVVNVSGGSGPGPGYGSRVIAFDRLSGRRLWARPTPGTYFTAPIASGSGRVVSVNYDGVARAFSLATGAPLWERKLGPEYERSDVAPVVGGGRAFVSVGRTVYALALSDGAVIWSRATGVGLGRGGMPVLDASLIYLSDDCGNAEALSQADGAVAWSRRAETGTCFGGPTMLANGRVFAGGPGGRVYSAATGADSPPFYPPGVPDSVGGGLAFRGGATSSAWSLADARRRWRFKRRSERWGAESLPPVVADETVYTTGPARRLYGLDRATGSLRMSMPLPDASYSSVGGIRGGIAVAQGVLAVTQGTSLSVYRPVLSPPARGVDAAVTTLDVVYGRKVGSVAGVGHALRGVRRPVTLLLDRFPYGRYHRAAAKRTLGDGTAYFRRRVTRTTRLRFRLRGRGRLSRRLTIYAYPRFSYTARALRRGGVAVRAKLQAGRDFRVGGRRLVLYHWRGRRARRLGTGRLRQAGRGRAIATVVVRRPPRVRPKDFLAYCVPGLPSRGFGRRNAFQRRCGRYRFRL